MKSVNPSLATMEDFAMEWNDICRVCLQDGDLISFYTKDDCDITICDKIMYCAAVNINSGENLPESICQTCVVNLETAFKFRTLCENSDNILQSYKLDEKSTSSETILVSEKDGEIYQFNVPQDLKVQKVKSAKTKKRQRPTIPETKSQQQQQQSSTVLLTIDKQEFQQNVIHEEEAEEDHEVVVEEEEDESSPKQIVQIKMEPSSDYEVYAELDGENTYNEEEDALNESLAREIRLANAELIELDTNHILDTGTGTIANLSVLDIKTESEDYLLIKRMNDDGTIIDETETKAPKPARGKRKRDDKVQRPHMCEICGKTYRYNFNLEAHMRRHTGEKPFACNICGRGFVISFELRRHMRCHTGQKPYKCKYCERKFSDFGSRIKHQRSHTGERPYACDVCGKTFAYSHVLSSHKLIHSGIKAYKCDACDKRFTKSHHLKAHLNVHLRNGIKALKPKIEASTDILPDELLLA